MCSLSSVMTIKLTLAKVTKRNRWSKLSYIQLNKNIELCTSTGSIFDNQITPGSPNWYWFAFDDAINRIVDMRLAVNGDQLITNLTTKYKNLIDATNGITDTYSQCSSAELSYVLQAAGVALSGAWTVWNGVTTVNALLSWEPVNLCLGLGMTAITGVVTKMQYDKLTETQRAAVAATERFQTALTTFHAVIKAYAPESMCDYAIASPAFTDIHNKIYKFLPKMDVTTLETNRPNWCVA